MTITTFTIACRHPGGAWIPVHARATLRQAERDLAVREARAPHLQWRITKLETEQ